ncbi:hypothetical protein Ndes2526B_g07754 [Nannochloris sp. 'desiccata']|nr:hypothetical protein KSW81_002421 [Chlorella desiccata (nom. nud.)]KAH7617161.1 hypothetical protein NADE_006947 [Chlorella desiccata (nom. nud.)]
MQCQGLLNSASCLNLRVSILPSLLPQKIKLISLPARRHHRSSSAVIVTARKQSPVSEADLYVSIDPSSATSPNQTSTAPWYISFPAGFIAILALLRTIGAWSRSRNRSLEERGYKPNGGASEDSYSKAMKGMKKVQMEELSDEQVQAARRRRRQEIVRDGGTVDLDTIELPDNHPFAVKEKVSEEEEEMHRLRLSARRGLSPEDMRLLKQQQQLAAQMEADAEDRERKRSQ